VINKAALDAYLTRKLDNWDFVKTDPSIDESLEILGIDGSKLWAHQRACLVIMELQQRFMFHIDMGGGKTFLMLSAMRRRKARGELTHAIVMVPFITATQTWVAEAEKHTPELSCVALTGSIAENRARLASPDADIYVICYQSAVAMMTGRAETKEGKTKWVMDPSLFDLFAPFDTLILDEIQKCSSLQSLTYKLCLALARHCIYVYGLTGTPFGKDPQSLWPQFNLIDGGETLGRTMGLYRAVFFNEKRNYWGGYEYKFKHKMLPKLTEVIKHKSIRYSIEELIDLPEKLYIPVYLDLPDSIEGYVLKAMEGLTAAQKANDTKVIEQNYLKLRQLSSGFLTLKGEDGTKAEISFDEMPKLDQLGSILAGMQPKSKLVVFHHFVFTNSLISDYLTSNGIKHARIYGKSRDPVGELRRFQTDPDCQVLVINSRSGSSSLNLQMANYMVFFEQPDSPIDRQQAEARVWRSGQTEKVFIYDLFMRKTYDKRIYESNAAGRSLLKELLDRRL
jgi:SNF2 family DNA or RNA helicase